MDGCLVLGKTALDSMQMAPQGALPWGTGDILGVMRATDWPAGMGNQSKLFNQGWLHMVFGPDPAAHMIVNFLQNYMTEAGERQPQG